MSDLSDLVCLAHDHGDRDQEAICSARFQIAALRSQLAAAESIAQAREVLIAALRADKDEARSMLTTAERERDEARRERDEWETMVGTQRLVLEGLHRRAELSEHVVKAVAGLAEVDVINGGEYFDDICVQPVLAAYHRYAFVAAEGRDA